MLRSEARGSARRLSSAGSALARFWRRVERRVVVELVLKRGLIQKYYGARELNRYGLNVAMVSDYFSPLPVVSRLAESKERWYRPSELVGVDWDLAGMERLLEHLLETYGSEYHSLASYEENSQAGYGLGFTPIDAMLQFLMLRHLKPRRYIEVGSGLSTYYCWLAAAQGSQGDHRVEISCIDPFASPTLHTLSGVEIIKREVQDIEISYFDQLRAGDVLFIDSTHVVKLDGEVPYLYLEVLPRLEAGVYVHAHDIPFPYNVPYPAETWVFGRRWPHFWTEAMLLQALLCGSEMFDIVLSMPLLRYHDEPFLEATVPGYDEYGRSPEYPFSSIWMRRA